MKNPITLSAIAFLSIMTTYCAAQTPGAFSYNAGKFEIILLSEGQGNGSASILIGASNEMIGECLTDGTFPNATNAFLVRTPDKKNILVDAGYGTRLIENLKEYGVEASQIDAILITHAHGDHISGLLQEGKPVFPKATLYLSKLEYDYWTNDSEMNRMPENRQGGFQKARETIAAYKDRLHLFQPTGIETQPTNLFDGVEAILAPGHTPGHTLYLIGSGKSKMLIWGDLTHAMTIQMPYPEVAVTYDVAPELAVESRKKVLKYVVKNNISVAGMHIPYPGMGTVAENGKGGYTFTPEK